MSDFLGNLVARASTTPLGVRPQVRSLFEPPLNIGPERAAGTTVPPMELHSVEEATRSNPPIPVAQRLAEVEALWTSAPASAERTFLNQGWLTVSGPQPSLGNNNAGKESFKGAPQSSELLDYLSMAHNPSVSPRTVLRIESSPQPQGSSSQATQRREPLRSTKPTSEIRTPLFDLPEEISADTFPGRTTVKPMQPPLPPTPDRYNSVPVTAAIHVTIGRVEVRAVLPTQKPRHETASPDSKLSLEAYLRRRNGEKP